MKTFLSKTAQKTQKLGESIGRQIKKGVSIALKGDLGAGKTTFVQGFARGLGISEEYYITSPTFNIVNEYPAGDLMLCHLDLYRLGSVEELEYIGFDDLCDPTRVIIVEWPEILFDFPFEFDLEIEFKFDKEFNRVISFAASGQDGSNLLSKFILESDRI